MNEEVKRIKYERANKEESKQEQKLKADYKRMRNRPTYLVKQWGYKNDRHDNKTNEDNQDGASLDEIPLTLDDDARWAVDNLLD